MASIRKRGPRQWEARIRRKGWPLTCHTFETKYDAEQWARQIESEMDKGAFISRAESESTTLQEALERYQVEYIPRLAHPAQEISRIRNLLKRPIAKRFLASIRGKDIAEFIREREAEGVGANTIRLDLALLSRMFEVAASDWGMEALNNPIRRANKPKLPGGRTRRLNKGEEEVLLSVCDPIFREVIRFAIETAMRREEIASLTWDYIDLKRRIAHLPRTKNGDARSVPLSPIAVEILQSVPRKIAGTVFGLLPDLITKKMGKVTKRAGLENLRFHDLRHEATSRFFENTDLDVMEIKTITGHKSMQMLARYSHLRAHKLADRLAGKPRGF